MEIVVVQSATCHTIELPDRLHISINNQNIDIESKALLLYLDATRVLSLCDSCVECED